MQSLNVVIAQNDSVASRQLTTSLRAHFHRVTVASDKANLREAIAHSRANLAVIDLDMVPVEDVRRLCQEFAGTSVVCVHRAPDYDLWNAALSAGALECCHPTDIPSILNAMRQRPRAHSAAA